MNFPLISEYVEAMKMIKFIKTRYANKQECTDKI